MALNEAASNEFDVVVIGAGPIWQNAADRARAAGLSVARLLEAYRDSAD